MAQDQNALILVDMEMTGLNCGEDEVLELAMVITDSQLNVLAESPVWAFGQSETVLQKMDEWNQKMHSKSGLLERVRASQWVYSEVELKAIEFLQVYVPTNTSPMCGNSICQDRRFMARCLPKLEGYFHYRNLDVSTVKELAKRWKPEVLKTFQKHGKHEALADIYESINELKHYRQYLMTVTLSPPG